MKVRLTADLTAYRTGLVAGTEGVTIGPGSNDRCSLVKFPDMAPLDVYHQSLECIDEEVLARRQREQEDAAVKKELHLQEILSAKNVVKYIFPKGKGELSEISFEFTTSVGEQAHISMGAHSSSSSNNFYNSNMCMEAYLKFFEDHSIPVQECIVAMKDAEISSFLNRIGSDFYLGCNFDTFFHKEGQLFLMEIMVRLGLSRQGYTIRKSDKHIEAQSNSLHISLDVEKETLYRSSRDKRTAVLSYCKCEDRQSLYSSPYRLAPKVTMHKVPMARLKNELAVVIEELKAFMAG